MGNGAQLYRPQLYGMKLLLTLKLINYALVDFPFLIFFKNLSWGKNRIDHWQSCKSWIGMEDRRMVELMPRLRSQLMSVSLACSPQICNPVILVLLSLYTINFEKSEMLLNCWFYSHFINYVQVIIIDL